MSDIERITTMDDFESIVEDRPFAFVLFTSEACTSCRKAYEALRDISSTVGLKPSTYRCVVPVESNLDLCEQFSVEKTPTLVVLKEGRVIEHLVGQNQITIAGLARFMLF